MILKGIISLFNNLKYANNLWLTPIEYWGIFIFSLLSNQRGFAYAPNSIK